MVIMLTCSAFYHLWCWDWSKANRLLSLDHIGISSMIMGAYTPIMQYCGFYRVLALVWILGIGGCAQELYRSFGCGQGGASGWSTLDVLHVVRYFVMTWACTPVFPEITAAAPQAYVCFGTAGLLLYTTGVLVFLRSSMEFHLPIWHGFVLAGAMCFYAAKVHLVGGMPAA
uniref:Uncharacterized protein n=1 Tax=Zooxanthella nutricula TaxID=1333877 RepID=A0A7S2JBD0_9DINO